VGRHILGADSSLSSVDCKAQPQLSGWLHLQAALSQQALSQKEGWLIASDARLLRAARREGLQTLNPERSTPEELQRLLI